MNYRNDRMYTNLNMKNKITIVVKLLYFFWPHPGRGRISDHYFRTWRPPVRLSVTKTKTSYNTNIKPRKGHAWKYWEPIGCDLVGDLKFVRLVFFSDKWHPTGRFSLEHQVKEWKWMIHIALQNLTTYMYIRIHYVMFEWLLYIT